MCAFVILVLEFYSRDPSVPVCVEVVEHVLHAWLFYAKNFGWAEAVVLRPLVRGQKFLFSLVSAPESSWADFFLPER